MVDVAMLTPAMLNNITLELRRGKSNILTVYKVQAVCLEANDINHPSTFNQMAHI